MDSSTVFSFLISATATLAITAGVTFFFVAAKKRLINLATSLNAQIFREIIQITHLPFLLLFALFIASFFTGLPIGLTTVIHKIGLIGLMLLIGLWTNVAINHFLEVFGIYYQKKKGFSVALVSLLQTLCKATVWTTFGLFVLDNLNFQISTLIAGLGIGGIAIALAVQNVLQDLFASLSIIIDEPFLIGDLVWIDDLKGYIEYIGIKTTRIRSVTGELIIISNANLLQSRLRNFKKMQERRVTQTVDVVYETPLEKVKQIPEFISQIVSKTPQVRFERAHLRELGAYALHFEFVYNVLAPDTHTYMEVQQAINTALLGKFQEEKIDFAYPTSRNLY